MLLNKTQQETSDNEMELQLGMASLKAMPSILSQKNLDSPNIDFWKTNPFFDQSNNEYRETKIWGKTFFFF